MITCPLIRTAAASAHLCNHLGRPTSAWGCCVVQQVHNGQEGPRPAVQAVQYRANRMAVQGSTGLDKALHDSIHLRECSVTSPHACHAPPPTDLSNRLSAWALLAPPGSVLAVVSHPDAMRVQLLQRPIRAAAVFSVQRQLQQNTSAHSCTGWCRNWLARWAMPRCCGERAHVYLALPLVLLLVTAAPAGALLGHCEVPPGPFGQPIPQ